MATKNERVSYIADILKKLGAPSATAIAICCNIRAESGPNFNPQAIEQGSGAPPFIRNGQGYGLFQFSNYPNNYEVYTACKNMSDKNAIDYQVKELNKQCQPGKGIWFTSVQYPKYNLSWNEFLTNKRNWTVRELTKAFMCEFERPADQTQDRYALYSKDVANAYDWSKYDKDGGSNAGNGDHESYNFDCGGSRITPPKEPDPDPPDPGGGNGIPTKQVSAAVDKIISRQKTGAGWTNGYGYQCVGLFQKGLFNLANPKAATADKKYADGLVPSPYRGTALGYGHYFNEQLNNGKKAGGLSPSNWQFIRSPKKFYKGDAIFYGKGNFGDNNPGHVAIARNSKTCLNQNISGRLDGSNPRIENHAIQFGGNLPVYGVLRKIKD